MQTTSILLRQVSLLEHPNEARSKTIQKDLLIVGHRIVKIADTIDVKSIPADCRTMEVQDCLALPGFVNAHTHNPMSLFRGFSDDLPLMDWLNAIWPAEAKMTSDMIYWGMKLSCLEMIKTGTTCFYDMYEHLPACAQAVDEMGLRCLLAETIFAPVGGASIEALEKKWNEHQQIVQQLKGVQQKRIQFALGPHAIYTVREEVLIWIGEKARQLGLPVHIHLSETKDEVANCQREHGCSPVGYLERCGVLDNVVIAAHGVHLSDSDIEILKKYPVTVVHNPNSNLKLASGYRFKYKELCEAGVNVALGTDGSCSSNNLDMFEAMKQAALLQKAWREDPAIAPAHEALQWANERGAQALKWETGRLEEGRLADIALVDLSHFLMVPAHNAISNLVYSAYGGVVKHVICDGQILMENRTVKGEAEILEQAARCARQLYA